MGVLGKSASAIGRLTIFISLLAVFAAGMIGVLYIQLKGEEVEIPKVVGMNFNDGKDELAVKGLRIKKIAMRYSKENPNTILEQRPRSGTTAKTGLTISVVVSEKGPDGFEEPVEIKDDEEAIEEIEDQPELKIEKPKKKAKPKQRKKKKTRDVVETKTEDGNADGAKSDQTKTGESKKPAKPATDKPATKKPSPGTAKPDAAKPKPAKPQKPKPTPAPRKKRVVGNN